VRGNSFKQFICVHVAAFTHVHVSAFFHVRGRGRRPSAAPAHVAAFFHVHVAVFHVFNAAALRPFGCPFYSLSVRLHFALLTCNRRTPRHTPHVTRHTPHATRHTLHATHTTRRFSNNQAVVVTILVNLSG
jgi:hypothetical protein